MAPTERTRVFVADDHPLFRDGLIRRIRERPELEFVGDASDGAEALSGIRALQPHVAVVDVRLPKLDGIEVVAAIAREELTTRVLMLSAFLDTALVYNALAAGARGYLSKDVDRQAVCDAIVMVARGEVAIHAELQAGLVQEIRVRGDTGRSRPLTGRERQILALVAGGASAPQIGKELHLSTGTVKTHLLHLYEKLGVSDRAAAVAEAMRQGLLE